MDLKKIALPKRYNYIACFLTFDCNYNCRYCINSLDRGKRRSKRTLSGRDWVRGLNRLFPSKDMPITLQGGEPSLHPDFFWIINHIDPEHPVDVLTNLSFDPEKFIRSIDPDRLKRKSPYASIRVTYHPRSIKIGDLINKVMRMKDAGFSVGVYGILHPHFKKTILGAQAKCQKLGIDFRTKEFLGKCGSRTFGKYLYPDAVSGRRLGSCLCRTTELLLGPGGDIFRCHHDLYEGWGPTGNILDPGLKIKDVFRPCDHYGLCNPCDIKIKTNRLQEYGHVSVDIKAISRKG